MNQVLWGQVQLASVSSTTGTILKKGNADDVSSYQSQVDQWQLSMPDGEQYKLTNMEDVFSNKVKYLDVCAFPLCFQVADLVSHGSHFSK